MINASSISNIVLNATNSDNRTTRNLTLHFTTTDYDGDSVYNATDWRVNGVSIASLNMPFNENISSGTVVDYSTYGNNGWYFNEFSNMAWAK